MQCFTFISQHISSFLENTILEMNISDEMKQCILLGCFKRFEPEKEWINQTIVNMIQTLQIRLNAMKEQWDQFHDDLTWLKQFRKKMSSKDDD